MFPGLNMVCGLEGLLESSLHVKSLQSCPTLYHPMDYSPPESLVPGICRHGYWTWLPFPCPEDLPDLGIEPILSHVCCIDRRVLFK